MSTALESQQALVAQNLAALSRHGMPLSELLPLLIEQLPSGELRAGLSRVVAALGRGEPPAEETDPLLAIIARSERTGSEALSESMRGFDLSDRANRTADLTLKVVSFVLLALAVMMWAVHAFVPSFYVGYDGWLPPMTRFVIEMSEPLRWLLPLSVVALWVSAKRLRPYFPGVTHFETASRLRLYAAGIDAGVSNDAALAWIDAEKPSSVFVARTLQLHALETALMKRVAANSGPAEAARMIASERERVGAVAYRRLTAFGPGLLVVVAGTFVGGFFVALYMPIFTMAGAIK